MGRFICCGVVAYRCPSCCVLYCHNYVVWLSTRLNRRCRCCAMCREGKKDLIMVDCRSRWQDLCGRVHITGEANTWRSRWACFLLFVYVSSKMWPAEEHHWVQPRDLSIGGAAGGWRRKVVQFPSPPSQAKKIFCLLRARAPSPLCFVVDGNENSSNFNLLPKE